MPLSRTVLVAALLAAAPLPAAAATGCPASDFAGFLKAFADDAAVQRAYTAVPLTADYIDATAEPEPATVTESLQGDALVFPVMPSRREQQRDGMEQRLATLPGGGQEVTLATRDSDGYQLRFRFETRGDCWQLVRKSDDSL